MTQPDQGLKARLDALRAKATDDDLADEGHHFRDGMGYADLTQCNHGDCGYFCNRGDGPLIAALWNAFRKGQLIPLADAEAMVDAEREGCIAVLQARADFYERNRANAHDADREMLMGDLVMAHDHAIDYLRARGVTE